MTEAGHSAELVRLVLAVEWDEVLRSMSLADQEYGSDEQSERAAESVRAVRDAVARIDGPDA